MGSFKIRHSNRFEWNNFAAWKRRLIEAGRSISRKWMEDDLHMKWQTSNGRVQIKSLLVSEVFGAFLNKESYDTQAFYRNSSQSLQWLIERAVEIAEILNF